jgi:hypothetical protein
LAIPLPSKPLPLDTTFLVSATQHNAPPPTHHHFNHHPSALKTTEQLKSKENDFKGHYTHHLVTEVETTWSNHISIAPCSHASTVGYRSLDKINLRHIGHVWEQTCEFITHSQKSLANIFTELWTAWDAAQCCMKCLCLFSLSITWS